MKCPRCNNDLVEIFYGVFDKAIAKQFNERKIYIGEIKPNEERPKYHCYKCNFNYYKNLKKFERSATLKNIPKFLINTNYIFSYSLNSAWDDLIYYLVFFERKEDNLYIYNKNKEYFLTINPNSIEKIINIIKNGNFYNIDYVKFPPVLDGNYSTFTFNIEKKHEIRACNMWYWLEENKIDEDINELLELLNQINDILKQNNIDLKSNLLK